MKHNMQDVINLKAIRYEVEDMHLSIKFYRKIGCQVRDVHTTAHTLSVYMSFNKRSDVVLHLLKDFGKTEPLTDQQKAAVYEITVCEEEDRTFQDVFTKISANGVHYTNVDPTKYISTIVKFIDVNDHKWELINDLNYDEPDA